MPETGDRLGGSRAARAGGGGGAGRRPPAPPGRGTTPARAPRAFTLMELMFVLLLIFVLLGILLIGMTHAFRAAKGSADTQAAAALKTSVEQFRQQFGFFPPLVRDEGHPFPPGPLEAGGINPAVYSASTPAHAAFLRHTGAPTPDLRFSRHSLPYYLLGVLAEAQDGKAGPGFREPGRDGSFKKTGRVFDPFFDTSRTRGAIFARDPAEGQFELRDRTGSPYRYYRWLRGNPAQASASNPDGVVTLADLNVPAMVGDPAENPALRSAEYAIVGAGPNGLFGDEDELPPTHPDFLDIQGMQLRLGLSGASAPQVKRAAREDNVVEVGQ